MGKRYSPTLIMEMQIGEIVLEKKINPAMYKLVFLWPDNGLLLFVIGKNSRTH